MAQHRGTVAWFDKAKGYGFLRYEGGPDIFVHFSAIVDDGYKALRESTPVEFDIKVGPRGEAQATRVRILKT